MDSNNEIITLFKGNKFGLGKFVFKPQKGKNYHCKITLKDGEVITKKIESITHKGIGLNVINHKLKNTIININTNEDTLPELINESCYLIIHRDGLIKKIEVPFIKNKLNYSFKIKKSLLHSGINIVTLLNPKMKPIAERIIFNDYNSPIKNINVKEITKEKDSSIIKLQVTDSEIKNINLSISVLPSKTKANKHNSSIVSSLLINPYIKGKIENPWYYFNKINSEKKYNLDLLLLTQGWSKYYWGDIFNNPPKISYNFETGFLIKGKINTTFKKGDKMIVQSKENGFSQESVISKEGIFTFNKLFIAENSTINFSLKSKKEKYKKPKIYYNIYPTYIYNLLRINKKDNPNSIFLSEDLESFTFDKKAIILDEVKIKSANVKPKPKNSPRGMFLAKHINFENIQNQSTLITEKLRPYFNVSNNGGVVSITSRRYRSLYTQSKPVVFLDNVNISESLDIIADLRVFETEEMFVSTSNSSIYNAAGVIHLYTKRGVSKPNENKYSDSTVGFGFSIPKKYYNPIYNELNEENFKSYGVLNWVPNLTRDENGELSFKISNKFDGPINLYIEGIYKDGFLFSKIKTISSHISF
ncbi:hypothetical protein [Polaribacter ponticola]|uniref:TonB-dependent receptor plug domain-containing protein n=1 Tax=Polaribacter ponticola TaxID=2978475 RepID=A0ABT5SA83_9FLAO|nr:hypothetical protein [Polaribacter sp. MSW5]MDD7915028.1 hypothetical protein [Polaribacter sp. MSW5]